MSQVCIYGAGSIGCYVGGRLQAGGARVTFVGRERLAREIRTHGLHLTDFLGASMTVKPADIRFLTDAGGAAEADLVLVTVKSAGTEQAGRELAQVLKPGAVVVSFQNGIGNADVLRQHLTRQVVLAGMVPFNSLSRGEGRYHQGTGLGLKAGQHERLAPFLPAFANAGLPLEMRADIVEVQWAKLLLNLNNPINALSDLPIKAELGQRAFRLCLASAQREALALLDAAGIKPGKLTPLPPRWMPRLMAGPDLLFRLLANRIVAVDPQARGSMWEDLQLGRTTEIDWINGEVVKLAQKLGRRAPINERLIALIREAENGGRRQWTGPELLAALRNG